MHAKMHKTNNLLHGQIAVTLIAYIKTQDFIEHSRTKEN